MLAIHHRPRSFSEKWIEYCDRYDVPYKIVNCYDCDIVSSLKGCDALLWHWAHYEPEAALCARQITYSLEVLGKRVFPSSQTSWHFDDKIGQKYLLESIDAPLVPTFIFYSKEVALEWVEKADFPKVFKLRAGAGSENVRLVRTHKEAKQLISKAFNRGFKAKNRMYFLKERLWQFKKAKSLKSFFNIAKGIARLFIPTEAERKLKYERNYVYFQEFVPRNDHDIRIIVIGKRAFAIKRMVRDGDFRASGSGEIIYDVKHIPITCVEKAFEISSLLGSQSLAFDFIFKDDSPLIVEMSYGFSQDAYRDCPGYWNEKLEWIEGKFYPEYFMIEDVLESIR